MKKIVFHFKTVTDFLDFKKAAKLRSFEVDFAKKTLTCQTSEELIMISDAFNLTVVTEVFQDKPEIKYSK